MKKLLIIVLLCSCTALPQSRAVGEDTKLPRIYGPIRLGMTVDEFQKTTNLSVSHSATCAEGEVSASFFTDEAYSLGPNQSIVRYFPDAKLQYQPRPLTPRLVFIYFYQKKLYRIVMNGVFTILPHFKKRYINNLGPPSYEDQEGNEYKLASFGWVDEGTELLVVHTAGDVWIDSVQIQYIDREIQNRMPKDKLE